MEQIVNLIANILIFIGTTFFIIGVFGRHSKKLDKLPFLERFFIKLGLTGTSCGALFNVLTLSIPSHSEILMNVGLGFVFCWAAWFHWKYFVIAKSDKEK